MAATAITCQPGDRRLELFYFRAVKTFKFDPADGRARNSLEQL
jgi:hypothetical protein